MIIPDVNLLLYAYNAETRQHEAARQWWTEQLNGSEAVGLAWVAILGFIRLTTSARVAARPLPVATACAFVRSWLERPQVSVIAPGREHATILFRLLEGLGVGANLTTDAHLAALAIEHQAQLQSTDADFARFPGLRWRNPLLRPKAH
ncbi:MAG: type II toxin-antitoxin system VapC family toxin [Terriglobales bacterium]